MTEPTKELVSMGDLNVTVDGDEANKPAPKSEPAPELESVKLGEKEFKVPAEVKAALDAAARAGVEVGELKSMVANLSNQIKAAAPKPEPKADEGYATILFTNPDGAIEKLTKEIENRIMTRVEQTNNQREFWDEFYRQNSDLKKYDEYVRFQFSKARDSYSKEGITVEEAMKRLAVSSKEAILKVRDGVELGGKSKPIGEGGSEGNKGAKTQSKDSTEGEGTQPSTADILRARREARVKASKPGRK